MAAPRSVYATTISNPSTKPMVCREAEWNAMLALVGSCFLFVPLELHLRSMASITSVTTFAATNYRTVIIPASFS